jgi:hypothetical protein
MENASKCLTLGSGSFQSLPKGLIDQTVCFPDIRYRAARQSTYRRV